MKNVRGSKMGVAPFALVFALAPAAFAGCGAEADQHQSASFVQAAYRPPMFRLVSDDNGRPSMIGMWSVNFKVGPDTIDFGYSVWHSDGTELLNSGSRAPATQNFCLGVWKQTGPFAYKLKHFALSYDLTGNLNARVIIREDIALAHDANTFTGTFTIDAYDPTGTTLLQHVAGDITGSRVTPD